MSHTIRFTDEGAEIRLAGTVTPDEIAVMQDELRTHEFPGELKWKLVDASQAQGARITSAVVQRAAEKARDFLKTHPKFAVAIVATNPLLFGFARMYEGYMGEIVSATRVFTSRTEAVQWLADHGAALADLENAA